MPTARSVRRRPSWEPLEAPPMTRSVGWLTGAGAASATSYALVVAAASLAPVGSASAVRETSVVLGTVGARAVLGEQVPATRLLSVAIVGAGVVLLALA